MLLGILQDCSNISMADPVQCSGSGLLRISASARMRAHHCPVDSRRDSLEHFGMVASLHVLEELLDLIACWVGSCHFVSIFLVSLAVGRLVVICGNMLIVQAPSPWATRLISYIARASQSHTMLSSS